MLPVGDRPLIQRIVEQLRDGGVRRVNVTTHYRGEVIADHLGDGSAFGVDIRYLQEDEPLGTAGRRAVALAREAGGAVSVDLASVGPLLAGGRQAAHDLVREIAPDLLFATATEAQAMLDTWRDTWSDEGLRVLYVVPARLTDAVLPLSITPPASSRVRVLVGRAEVLPAA